MAACRAMLPLPSASTALAQTQEVTKRGSARVCSVRLRPQSVRDLSCIKGAPACKNAIRSFGARARMGGDGNVDLSSDPVAEDFYSVLGLVCDLEHRHAQDFFSLMSWLFFLWGCFHVCVVSFRLQTPDATADEIKKAYYSCMKTCHPDLSGNSSDSTDFCIFINEIYEVLVVAFSLGFRIGTLCLQ